MKSPAPDIAGIDTMNTSPYSRENVRRGVTHYLLGRGMSAAAGFVTVILLVRHMEMPAYAGYTAILGFCGLAGMLAGLGLERALVRFIPEGVMHHPGPLLARFIWIACAARLAVMVLLIGALWLSWPVLAGRVAGLALAPDFPLALAFVLLSSATFQLFSAVMQALVQQKILTRVLVVQWGGRLLLILALLAGHAGITLEQALWLMALPDGIGALILAWAIHRYMASQGSGTIAAPGNATPWPPWAQVRKLARDNYGYNLLAALPQNTSMIILAAVFLTAPFVAVYGFYIHLLERFKQYLPLQFMLNLAEPVLIAGFVRDGDFGRLSHHSRLLYKCNLLLLMPGLAWIAAIAQPLTHVLTAGKYTEHAWILPLLILQLALGGHATIMQIMINAVGKSGILTISGCLALAAMALAIGVALASGQYAWLVAAPLAYELVNNLVAVGLLGKHGWHYDLQWGFHGKLLLATLGAWLGAMFASAQVASPLGQVLLAGVVALALFGLGATLLRLADPREFQTVRDMLKRKQGPAGAFAGGTDSPAGGKP
ncbi:lipopolysaccharide biosynthesis protein [Noviherbaspirillum sedimenti]|uniref:Polysaccharide biosynthesis protein C-terminal domain-containing protein n=1 Tax=Noviherbaspirillum sedimenti TaxID=2320865 RepID=A0A3A3FZI6_9BURK|nr:oligosaccharide flippase family protein [Noviherbaspirillum sedimenti]RJG01081.1 hypothetical protein D3878_05360 [Noviherbaspirillum sedimenti]